MVRKETCAEVAEQIDIGSVLRLGRSEMLTGGRRKKALLGDAMEAVIAAIFLDSGFETARSVVRKLWKAQIENVKEVARDPKTELQEWAQSCGFPPPTYVTASREGQITSLSLQLRHTWKMVCEPPLKRAQQARG